ncbi:MAG: hypothetical protein NTY35_09370 [Planctomycetota bacterium]|nr:hypothetical protein [Planctomycetota bacterium]
MVSRSGFGGADMDMPGGGKRSGRAGARGAGLALLAAGLGVLGACLAAFAAAEPPPAAPGETVLWAADRDASRVYGLDADLYLTRRLPVDWPLDVEPAGDGGLWVLRAETGSAASTQRLDRFDAAGALVTELWIERAADLDVLAGGEQALVVEVRAGALPRLVRVRTEGSLFPLIERDGLACVSGERESAVLGTRSGEVLRVHAITGGVLASANLGGHLADLAAGPAPGMVWALDDSGPGRILLLAADLTVRWSAPLPRPARHLAPVRGEERVWVANTEEPCVVRFGPGGAVELDRCGLPLPGLDRALAWRGGVLVTAVGAILRLDQGGNLRPGQGGFDFVSDLAPTAR